MREEWSWIIWLILLYEQVMASRRTLILKRSSFFHWPLPPQSQRHLRSRSLGPSTIWVAITHGQAQPLFSLGTTSSGRFVQTGSLMFGIRVAEPWYLPTRQYKATLSSSIT